MIWNLWVLSCFHWCPLIFINWNEFNGHSLMEFNGIYTHFCCIYSRHINVLMVQTFSTLLKIVKRATSSSASSDSLTRPSCFVLGFFFGGAGVSYSVCDGTQ